DVNEKLTVEADGAYAKSWLNPGNTIGSSNGDIGYGGALGTNLGFNITADSNKAFPTISNFGPAGNAGRWADPTVIGSHVTVLQTQKNTDELKQFRGVVTWKAADDITLKAGGQYTDDTFNLLNRSTFTNNFWQAYAGYGGPSGQGSGVSPLPSSLYQGTISLNNFIPGFAGSLPPSLLIYSPQAYQNYLTSLGNPQAQNVPGFNYNGGVNGFTGQFVEAVDPGSILSVNEKTLSLFFSGAMEGRIGNMPLHAAFGVRTENTRLLSIGQGRAPTQITRSAADPTLLSIAFTDTQPIANRSSYTYVLPSVDLRLEVTDNLQLRFDASRTLTRPGLSLLNPVVGIGNGQRVGALSGSGGNPNLK
ncbi:TonB-dependent receptor domain-containing protein, partial [Sphingomonas sanguinis]